MTQTHFGYETVEPDEKTARVGQVFDSVAAKYDAMNDLMSFGVHRLWKRFAINLAAVKPGMRVLDLACGTGDLSAKLASQVGPTGHVIASDINSSMLNEGRHNLVNQGVVGTIDYILADAEQLPFKPNTFDAITIAFGLRNVTTKENALAAMQRVLKPGGRTVILEFSKPIVPGLKPIYDLYSFNVLPMLGKLVADDAASYRYLAESIRMHPDQATLCSMMQVAGFEQCEYFNLSGGIVAAHRGYKF